MKKVLSVLLAAAMVMGMSVSAFAAGFNATPTAPSNVDYVTWGGEGTAAPYYFQSTDKVEWPMMMIERDGTYTTYTQAEADKDAVTLEAGDTLYFFPTLNGNFIAADDLPSNIKIKINNADYIDGASFETIDKDSTSNLAKAIRKAEDFYWNKVDDANLSVAFVEVALEEDFDYYTEDEVEFYLYLHDTKTAAVNKLYVNYDFANYSKSTLTEAKLDWVITVTKPTTYTYKKGEKAAYATIDFDGNAYGEFKMYPGEKYTLSSTIKYNKDLAKEYDTEVEVVEFRLKNVDNIDLVFESAKDNKQVVAVVDGELVPVEATYVEDHKFDNGDKVDGYLVENAEYTAYALIDADVEIEVEAEEPVETPVEADKANPETGAADFVGAAVAMAVVSVAAAGALALKK